MQIPSEAEPSPSSSLKAHQAGLFRAPPDLEAEARGVQATASHAQ